jgi:hypothetical protein
MPRKPIPGWQSYVLDFTSPQGKTSQPTPLNFRPAVPAPPMPDQNTGSQAVSATSMKPLGSTDKPMAGVGGGGNPAWVNTHPTTFGKGKR